MPFSQNQVVCIRQEVNYCFICYSQTTQEFMDFGISNGQRKVCSYYRFTEVNKFSQTTCGAQSWDTKAQTLSVPDVRLRGRSLLEQRAETLMTHTGSLRGSFVSFLLSKIFVILGSHCYDQNVPLFKCYYDTYR